MKLLLVVLSVFALNHTTFAQDSSTPSASPAPSPVPVKKKSKKKVTKPAEAVATPTPAEPTPTQNEIQFSGAFSIGTLNSFFAFGPSVQGEIPMTIDGNHFKFGGETGFFYATQSGVHGFSIPLIATGTYLLPPSGSLKLYAGVGMGISIDHASTSDITVAGITVSGASSTDVHFVFLLRPGLTFGEQDQYFAELPIGTLFDGFALLPTFGMHF